MSIRFLDDYMDNDVAYLLGLIMIRGTFHIEGDVRRLIIHFPYQLMEVQALPNSNLRFNQDEKIRLSLDDIRRRINELLDVNVDIERNKNVISLKAVFTKNTMSWRNLRLLCKNKTNFYEFEIPEVMYEMPEDIQKEFIRGIADAASSPSYSDRDQAGYQRVVFQFPYQNWQLPLQVCKLLQENLGIKVQHILWGHPNIRTPEEDQGHWAKEHRMRIYAEEFIKIGFNFEYKQEILKEMAKYNLEKGHNSRYCNPKIKKIRANQIKPMHPDESSEKLPFELRGKHFDTYFQICCALGCKQGKESNQKELYEDEL